MDNFDDSSDEEDVVETLDNNLSENWQSFMQEVFEDLKQRANLLNEQEKENKDSLYFALKAFKEDITIPVEAKNIADKIDSSLPVLKIDNLQSEIVDDLDVNGITKKIDSHYQELADKIREIFELYNKYIKKSQITAIYPKFKKEICSDFTFKRTRRLTTNLERRQCLSEGATRLGEWLKIEKDKITAISKIIKNIQNILEKIDQFMLISIPEIDNLCKLSFLAHYIGTGLLHHTKVTSIYKEDKKQHLTNVQVTNNFQYSLLKTSILLKSLIEFNKLYENILGSKFISDNLFYEPLMELQNEDNLRSILKKMNGLNDYLLLREMYKYIASTTHPFGSFIRMSSEQVLGELVKAFPIFGIYHANIKDIVDGENFDNHNTTDLQIMENEHYHYKGYEDSINMDSDEKDLKDIIVSSNIPPIVYRIYKICEKNNFNSIKEFYTQNDNSDINLAEDTLRLALGLSNIKDTVLKLITQEPSLALASDTEEWKKLLKQRGLILIQNLNQQESEYKIYILNLTLKYKIEDEHFNQLIKQYSEEEAEENVIDPSTDDSKYLKQILIEKIEKEKGEKLFFSSTKTLNRAIQILMGNNIGSMPGDDLLHHAFMLVLRNEFYKLKPLKRAVLPVTFEFTTISPIHFISNIRLSNRSLTRQARNLLQHPATHIQIETINSGSEPLVSIAKTWHFATDKKEPLSSSSFFAVDRQILNSKRSEKKKTLLSREHSVAKIGAYSEIHDTFLKNTYFKHEEGNLIAQAILEPITNPNIEASPQLPETSEKRFYFSNLFYLLFGVESMRNPAMFIINRMLIDLLEADRVNIDQCFSGNGIISINGVDYMYVNGLMPTAPKSITARSREINNLYHRYMPNSYIYPGDLSRSTTGVPKNRDTSTKMKWGVNHLMYREALVVSMWFRFKTGKDAYATAIHEIGEEIAKNAEDWWGLQNSP